MGIPSTTGCTIPDTADLDPDWADAKFEVAATIKTTVKKTALRLKSIFQDSFLDENS